MTLQQGEGEVGSEGRERRSRVGSDRGKVAGRRCSGRRGRKGGWAEQTMGEGRVNALFRGRGGVSVEKEEGCVFSHTLVYPHACTHTNMECLIPCSVTKLMKG